MKFSEIRVWELSVNGIEFLSILSSFSKLGFELNHSQVWMLFWMI